MDSALPQQPVEQVLPTGTVPSLPQHDAASPTPQPRLEQQQGEHLAPAPTSGTDVQPHDASAPTESPQFDVEEFLRIKQEREEYQRQVKEQEGIISQIKQMADEQRAAQESQKQRGDIQQEIATLLRRSGHEDDELSAALTDFLYGRLDTTTKTYQQQMTDYQRQVDDYASQAIWAGTKDAFAQHMLSEYQLDPAYLPRLQNTRSNDEMVMVAEALRDAQRLYAQQAYSRTVQTQEEERRASGVDVINGTSSGPLASGELKPGRNLDVLGAILSRA